MGAIFLIVFIVILVSTFSNSSSSEFAGCGIIVLIGILACALWGGRYFWDTNFHTEFVRTSSNLSSAIGDYRDDKSNGSNETTDINAVDSQSGDLQTVFADVTIQNRRDGYNLSDVVLKPVIKACRASECRDLETKYVIY